MVEDRADLSNAIAINSSMVNMARLVGPSLAGMLIAVTSEGWCFLIDGISYIAVIASLLMMRIHFPVIKRRATSAFTDLKVGWEYVTEFLPIRTILTLFALVSLMGMPYVVLMPIFAARVLHGGAHTLGFLMGAMGIGALVSAFWLAARRSVRGLVRMIPVAAAVFGLGLIGFGFSHVFWLSMAMVMIAGMGMMMGMAASNTVIQTIVSEDKRGRVMSYYTMAFMGMAPFGSLLAGTMANGIGGSIASSSSPAWLQGISAAIANGVGAPWTVIINGCALLLGALWFTTKLPKLRDQIRPIYQEMGILPSPEGMHQ
jgi:MFS family permease